MADNLEVIEPAARMDSSPSETEHQMAEPSAKVEQQLKMEPAVLQASRGQMKVLAIESLQEMKDEMKTFVRKHAISPALWKLQILDLEFREIEGALCGGKVSNIEEKHLPIYLVCTCDQVGPHGQEIIVLETTTIRRIQEAMVVGKKKSFCSNDDDDDDDDDGEGVIRILAGLSDGEVGQLEGKYGFRFPPDVKAFLQVGVPVGKGFYDWHELAQDRVKVGCAEDALSKVLEKEICVNDRSRRKSDKKRMQRTLQALGMTMDEVERGKIQYPLIPLCGHRMIATVPNSCFGLPIMSFQMSWCFLDNVVYAKNFWSWLEEEFVEEGTVPSSWTHIFVGRQVELWSSRLGSRFRLPLPSCELPFWNKWMCQPYWNKWTSYTQWNAENPSSSEEDATSDLEGGHSEDEQE